MYERQIDTSKNERRWSSRLCIENTIVEEWREKKAYWRESFSTSPKISGLGVCLEAEWYVGGSSALYNEWNTRQTLRREYMSRRTLMYEELTPRFAPWSNIAALMRELNASLRSEHCDLQAEDFLLMRQHQSVRSWHRPKTTGTTKTGVQTVNEEQFKKLAESSGYGKRAEWRSLGSEFAFHRHWILNRKRKRYKSLDHNYLGSWITTLENMKSTHFICSLRFFTF